MTDVITLEVVYVGNDKWFKEQETKILVDYVGIFNLWSGGVVKVMSDGQVFDQAVVWRPQDYDRYVYQGF